MYLYIWGFGLLLAFCSCSYQSEIYDDKIEELEEEIENFEIELRYLEEDFYLSYNALNRIDSLLAYENIDSARTLIKTTLPKLGERRFYKMDESLCLDILNFQFIRLDADTSVLDFSRQLRYDGCQEQIDSFRKEMDLRKVK